MLEGRHIGSASRAELVVRRKGPNRAKQETLVKKLERLVRTGQYVFKRLQPLIDDPTSLPVALANMVQRLRQHGPMMVAGRLTRNYETWASLYDRTNQGQRQQIMLAISSLKPLPFISVVLYQAIGDPEAAVSFAELTARSLSDQLFTNWELIITGAPQFASAAQARLVENHALAADKCKVVVTANHFRSMASVVQSEAVLAAVSGELVVPVASGDQLADFALYLVARQYAMTQSAWIYADSDEINDSGLRALPAFFSSWDEDLFYEQGIVPAFNSYSLSALKSMAEKSEVDFEFALRMSRAGATPDGRGKPEHLPYVLVHKLFRAEANMHSKLEQNGGSQALHSRRQALLKHFNETKVMAQVDTNGSWFLRVSYDLPSLPPPVAVIIPTRDRADLLERCLSSLRAVTTYGGELKVILVDNNTVDKQALEYMDKVEREGVTILRYPHRFNFSAMSNLAASKTDAEILLFMNNDIEVRSAAWLTEMVRHALRPDVGAVGAKLSFPDGRIQHAGLLLYETANDCAVQALYRTVSSAYVQPAEGHSVLQSRLSLTQQFSAVTGACMAVRKVIYDEVGGMDPELASDFSDVDLCLRLRQRGYKIIWTPQAQLIHMEAATRGQKAYSYRSPPKHRGTLDYIRTKWGPILKQERYFSPNLELSHGEPVLAFPPRCPRPWDVAPISGSV
jgi:GT2 family glycosyltransferase